MPCYDQSSHCYIGCGVNMARSQDRSCLLDAPPVLQNRRMFHKSFESVVPPWAIEEKSIISLPVTNITRQKSFIPLREKSAQTMPAMQNETSKGLQVSMSVGSLSSCPNCEGKTKQTQTLAPITACIPLSANPNSWLNTINSKSHPNLLTRSDTLPKLSERRIPASKAIIEKAQVNLKKNYITRKPFSIKTTKPTTNRIPKPVKALKAPPYCQVNPSNIYEDSTTRMNESLCSDLVGAPSLVPRGKNLRTTRIFRQVDDYRNRDPRNISKINIYNEKTVDLNEYIDIQIEFLDCSTGNDNSKMVNNCYFTSPTTPMTPIHSQLSNPLPLAINDIRRGLQRRPSYRALAPSNSFKRN